MQILSKKVDLSKVTSKCGSKDNIKHKPGELGNGVLTLSIHSKALLDALCLYALSFSWQFIWYIKLKLMQFNSPAMNPTFVIMFSFC